MRNLAYATLAITFVFSLLAGAGLFVVGNLDLTLARYPGATPAGEEHLNVLSLSRGYAIHSVAYQTRDDVMTVWQWYAHRLQVEPAEGIPAQGTCVMLAAGSEHVAVRRTVEVNLCPGSHRTLVFVTQTWYLGVE
jgi:hypothetical protein